MDDFLGPYLNLRSVNDFIDRLLAKIMGGILAVILIIIAVICTLGWIFIMCAFKPGCQVYKWRKEGGVNSSAPNQHQGKSELVVQRSKKLIIEKHVCTKLTT